MRCACLSGQPSLTRSSVYGPTTAFFLDLPLFRGDEAPQTGYVAANANPWPGAIAFYRSPTTSGFELNTLAELQATHGETVFDFYSGPLYRYDQSNTLRVILGSRRARLDHRGRAARRRQPRRGRE